MPGSSIIFLVIVALLYVVSAIFQARQARQQQEEAQRAIRERRAQAQNRAQGRAGSTVPGETGRSRQEELAARRRAQLEELRRRRSAGESGEAEPGGRPVLEAQPEPIIKRNSRTTSARTGGVQRGYQIESAPVSTPGTTGSGQGPAAPTQRASEFKPTASTSRSRASDVKSSDASRADIARRRPTTRDATLIPGVKAVTATEIGSDGVVAELPDAYGQRISPVAPLVQKIRSGQLSRAAWREAIVLKEILDTPVSLRQ